MDEISKQTTVNFVFKKNSQSQQKKKKIIILKVINHILIVIQSYIIKYNLFL